MATSRIYNPEAEDIYGPGFFSLQVQVSQFVAIASTFLLWSEVIKEILDAGFDVSTNGNTQFRTKLRTNSLFSSVDAVVVRGGLSPPVDRPSSMPSTSPTTLSPTTAPSLEPSTTPTLQATDVPSSSPSSAPTLTFSTAPSLRPSSVPTGSPTTTLELNPTFLAGIDESNAGATAATSNQTFDAPVIAAIVGATVTFISACMILLFLWLRHRTKKQKRHTMPKEVALSKQIGNGFVPPGVVELDNDQRSLAETTLGERTAGWNTRPRKVSSIARPSGRQGKHAGIRPLDSFDENSLYTTPFSEAQNDDDDESKFHPTVILPLPTPSDISSQAPRPSALDSHMLQSADSHDTTSSDGFVFGVPLVKSAPPVTARRRVSPSKRSFRQQSTPIDCDSNEPYEEMIITRIEPLDAQLPTVEEHDDFALDPEDLDVWSCDFDDFERRSDFFRGDVSSNPTSLTSTTSTAPVNNTNLEAPKKAVSSSVIGKRGDVESQKDSVGPIPDQIATKKPQRSNKMKVSPVAAPSAENILNDLRNDPQNLKRSPSLSSSKSSQSSKKSLSSMKTQTGSQYRLDPASRESSSSKLVALTDSVVNPLTKLFESMAIPSATPEGNESDEPSEGAPETINGGSKKPAVPAYRTQEEKDDDGAVSESEDSGMSASPWLMETVEDTLGPRSVNADMESLSGVSNRSHKSGTKRGPNAKKSGSEASFGSRFSSHVSSVMSAASSSMSTEIMAHRGSEISVPTTKSALKNDLKRLERQLAALEERGDTATTTSSVTMTSITGTSLSTLSSRKSSKVSRRRRIVVMVPPGKLGVILANRHDGKGTVVAELRPNSPLEGMLSPGDKLVQVDDVQVDSLAWTCSQITSLIAKRANQERRLTVITSNQ